MNVQAAQGLTCPKEGKPREYITDSEPVEVPDTSYYRRLVRDGSIVMAEDAGRRAEKTKKQKEANDGI